MSGTVQLAAASLLGRLQVQALHGPRVSLTLQRLLPPGLVAAIQASPAVSHCPASLHVLMSSCSIGPPMQAASCSCALLGVCAVLLRHHCKRWSTASTNTCEKRGTLHPDPQSAQCALQDKHIPMRNKPCNSGHFAASTGITAAAPMSTWHY